MHAAHVLADGAEEPVHTTQVTCHHGADAGGAHGVVWEHGWGQALQPGILPPLQLLPRRSLLDCAPQRCHQKLRQHLLPCILRVPTAAAGKKARQASQWPNQGAQTSAYRGALQPGVECRAVPAMQAGAPTRQPTPQRAHMSP